MPADLPAHAHEVLDLSNWRQHVAEPGQQMKRLMDKGSILPVKILVGSLFAFNFVMSLPREMAHNQQEERRRFKLDRH